MKNFLILMIFGFLSFLKNATADEPIIFNGIEKSATCYIADKLALGLDKKQVVITNKVPPFVHIQLPQLKQLIRFNGLAREHLAPTENNISLLKKHNLKMIFHVRDLRQRVVSFAHYHMDYVKRKMSTVEAYKSRGHHDVEKWTLNDFIEYHIGGIPHIVKRIDGWLKVYEEGTIPILITSFEEFLDDERSFFSKILDFYNIPEWKFKNKYVPKDFNHKFRKGEKEEWRTVLTDDQIQRINAQIPDEYFSFFGWEY